MTGVIFDPTQNDVHEELRIEIGKRNLEVVLDPKIMELASLGGFSGQRTNLPWAGERRHVPADLRGRSADDVADAIAQFVALHGYSAVLAPSHYLENGAEGQWCDVDSQLTIKLRDRLDKAGCKEVAIFYPFATSTKVFYDPAQRRKLKDVLCNLPIDQLWLRIQSFGGSSGHLTLRRYIEACRDLHALPFPLIAEKTGNIGLALLAFGAVGGIDSGVSSGERFDFKRLTHESNAGPRFSPHRRVYIPTLGLFLPRDNAKNFFAHRTLKANFACANTDCCRRGADSMIADPRRHFVLTRMGEVSSLSNFPPTLRPTEYLERVLRPATDKLGRAMQYDLDKSLKSTLERTRRKLDGWRDTLGEMSRTQPAITLSKVLVRRIVRLKSA